MTWLELIPEGEGLADEEGGGEEFQMPGDADSEVGE